MKEFLKKYQYLSFSAKRRLSSQFAGNFKSAFKGNGLVFSDFKNREDGEDANGIDWLVSAREGKLLTRRMEEDRALNVTFFVDVSSSMDFWFRKTKKEIALEILCMLWLSSLEDGNRVGAFLFWGEEINFTPHSKNKTGVLTIFSHIFKQSKGDTLTSLETAIKTFRNMKLRRNLVFIISDKMDIDESLCRWFFLENEVVYMNVFHSFENTLELDENVTLQVSSNIWEWIFIDTSDTTKKNEFVTFRNQKILNFSKKIRKLWGDYLLLDETKEIFKEFLIFMRKREARL